MKRSAGLFLVVALATSCATQHSAAAPTTTAAPVTSATTVPTTGPPTTLPPGQAFSTKVPGVLTVGAETFASPWYVGATPESITQGFEYDLAKAIAARLRIPQVRVVQTNLVAMLAGEEPECDLVLDEVTVTDDRAKALDLSEPYLTVGQAVVVRKGAVLRDIADGRTFRWGTTLHDAAGVDIVTNRVKSVYPPDVVVDSAEGVRRLAAGDIDAFVLDTPFALAAAESTPGLEVAGQFKTNEQYAAVLPLGSPNTVFLNDVLGAAVDDGTVSRLVQRYFGADLAAVPVIAT